MMAKVRRRADSAAIAEGELMPPILRDQSLTNFLTLMARLSVRTMAVRVIMVGALEGADCVLPRYRRRLRGTVSAVTIPPPPLLRS